MCCQGFGTSSLATLSQLPTRSEMRTEKIKKSESKRKVKEKERRSVINWLIRFQEMRKSQKERKGSQNSNNQLYIFGVCTYVVIDIAAFIVIDIAAYRYCRFKIAL